LYSSVTQYNDEVLPQIRSDHFLAPTFQFIFHKSPYNSMYNFSARSQKYEKRLLAPSCLSARMEQIGSHWMDFHEILYFWIFRKSVEKIKVSLKSDKTNGYFIQIHMYIYDNISLNSSQNKKIFKQNLRENQNMHFMFKNVFFTKIVTFMRPEMTI
jgi:hypothetical protein